MATAGVGWWFYRRGEGPPPATRPVAPQVAVGRDYYFFVRLVEFAPRRPDGKAWDGDGSAPDALVKLTWRGNRMFSLPTRQDQLISTWDLFRVDVKDIVLKGGASIDISSLVNGPIVNVASGDRITIEVYDNDTVGNDLALKMDLEMAQLREGRNDIEVQSSGIVRLRIDMLACDTPLAELINWQTGGK